MKKVILAIAVVSITLGLIFYFVEFKRFNGSPEKLTGFLGFYWTPQGEKKEIKGDKVIAAQLQELIGRAKSADSNMKWAIDYELRFTYENDVFDDVSVGNNGVVMTKRNAYKLNAADQNLWNDIIERCKMDNPQSEKTEKVK